MSTYLGILAFIFGLAFGSFVNVCIHRIPRREPLALSWSHCPQCGASIKAFDNIPLLSFIWLGGKCRNCQAKISWRYPIVELLTTLVFLFSYWHFGWGWEFISKTVFLILLIIIFFIDLEHKIIPDVISLPGIGLGLGFSLLIKSITFWQSLAGFLVGGVLLYLIALLGDFLFKKESMGGGDIKMAAMLGAFLGWQNLLLSFFVAVLLGALVGIVTIFFSSKVRESRIIPFGPFLALGAFVSIFWSKELIQLYIQAQNHIQSLLP
ncbi:MAG: prepilin peptidase [candidate division Zixibacteria bacterium]|nr:prepilin peptidase [candidate division Zixibacteria bacterium]